MSLATQHSRNKELYQQYDLHIETWELRPGRLLRRGWFSHSDWKKARASILVSGG